MAQKGSRAVELFSSGYNCAEAVVLAVGQNLGLASPLIPRIATPFGGGIGRSGGTCGALVGAVLAVGLLKGRDSAEGDKGQAYNLAQHLYSAFQEEMGSTLCRDLTGLDLRTPEGIRLLYSEVKERVCHRAVALAERLALEALRPAREG